MTILIVYLLISCSHQARGIVLDITVAIRVGWIGKASDMASLSSSQSRALKCTKQTKTPPQSDLLSAFASFLAASPSPSPSLATDSGSCSPERTSSVILFVSGIHNVVKIPKNINSAKISITCGNHGLASLPVAPGFAPRTRRGAIAAWAMMAPIFPEAAEKP